LTDGHWSEDFPFPGAKELGKRYAKKVNKYSLKVGFDDTLVQMPSTAIKKAGTLDSEKVKQVFLWKVTLAPMG